MFRFPNVAPVATCTPSRKHDSGGLDKRPRTGDVDIEIAFGSDRAKPAIPSRPRPRPKGRDDRGTEPPSPTTAGRTLGRGNGVEAGAESGSWARHGRGHQAQAPKRDRSQHGEKAPYAREWVGHSGTSADSPPAIVARLPNRFISMDVLSERTDPSHNTKFNVPAWKLPHSRLQGFSPPGPPAATARS